MQGTARRIAEAVEEIPKCVAHYRKQRTRAGHLPPYRLPWPVQKEPDASRSFAEGSGLLGTSRQWLTRSREQALQSQLYEAGREVPPRQRRAGRVGLGSKVLVCCRIRSAPSALGSGFPGLLLGPTVFGLRTLVGWWEQRSLACRLLGAPCVGPGDHVPPRKLSSAGPGECSGSLKPGWRCKAGLQWIKHGNPRAGFSCKIDVCRCFQGLLMPS